MFVDSHCHLSFPELHGRLPQILADMREAKVAAALCICTTLEEFPTVQALAAEHTNLWASVGVHPDTEGLTEPSEDDLCRLAAQPKVIAIGETGLDYYRLNGRSIADMEWQRDRFRAHIRAARRLKLPLIIHTRSASDDTIALLKEEGAGQQGSGIGGVFHCFTETMDVARAALDLGFHISFSGIVSFRNAADLREVVRFVPLERCLIETDSPYLAPVPYRGKTNSPAYVPHVASVLAAEKGFSVEEIAQATTHNFERLFQVQVPALAAA
ncbi:MAG TPA: TatD family hydrolase [Ideonella sp.]|uniref:TatD family hydrolase n=1 Tax=Ideonella sp. TaxID=1929293 RepID=UPI002E30D0E9|nr:TatD family hydrolase [Ideonella sp.]HEX5688210.1 TatD family hydrolase [Ideonella sp.]